MARANKRASPRQQRGVAAIFAAIALITLLSAVTLAIDVGRLYNAQRSLQRLADLAAIDGARVRSQCLGPAGFDEVTAEVSASLARNRKPEDVSPVVKLGLRQSGLDGLQVFRPTAANQQSDSVQVTLKRPSPARILPLFAGDDSRMLTARAAAQGKSSATVPPPLPAALEADPEFSNPIFGGQLNSAVSLSGNQLRASAEATVDGSTLVDAEQTVALPDVDVPQPVQGLLNALLAALDAAGDQFAATTVATFGEALRTGRGAVDVVPADLLGLQPGQTYDDVTIPVSNLLANIASTVSDGEPITFPVKLPPPLGDGVRITVRPGRPGTASPGFSLGNSSSNDAAFASASFLRIEVQLLNPVTGQPFTLPLYSQVEPAQAHATDLRCARLGQDGHRVTVEAQGTVATFAIGELKDFTGSGLDRLPSLAGLPPVTLFPLTVLGQTVTIATQLEPVTIGDARSQTFCFSGPPFGVAEQCDGSAATVGGVSSDQTVQALTDALQSIRLVATLPPNLPAALAGPVQAQVDAALVIVSAQLMPALSLLAQQIVPKLQGVNLTAGVSEVRVSGVKVVQPEVYAQ